LKIAYVTTYDASDIHAWSGTGFYIRQVLRSSGFDLECIGNLRTRAGRYFGWKHRFYARRSKNYMMDRDPLLLRSYARQVKAALSDIDADVVFSPGTIPIAYLKTQKPIVFWTDATFAGMVDFYEWSSNLCRETIRDGNKMEQLALSRCRLAIYSSDWAAKTAIDYYKVDSRKVKVVPFGANVDADRDYQTIEALVSKKDLHQCQLLFIGVDWLRKGGDKALSVAERLNQKGMPTRLHVVGCNPTVSVPPWVTVHGFISKDSDEGRRRLNQLFNESHFLVLPSRAECCAIVLNEAGSFGLPSLATNVGGIPTAIRNGINGCTFPLDASDDEYAEYVLDVMASRERYRQLALTSFKEYSERLSWSSIGKRVTQLIHETIGNSRAVLA
jgi:glycosyltransferase involved in cell wall biosynthesis